MNAPSSEPRDPLIGKVLADRYEIESSLGAGGMGAVYVGRHRTLDKAVAIKVLKEATDKTAQQRFLQEARLASSVSHPHVIETYDCGILDDGRPYLVMELLAGETLAQKIADRPMEPLQVCRLGRQMALGLQAVHDKLIIHRDLKPANIVVLQRDRADFIKILDFGIAKVMAGRRQTLREPGARGAVQHLTEDGQVVGTPEYMPPEQAEGQALDSRTDQYALGCILYEMLTGTLPFTGQGWLQIAMQHLKAPVPPLRSRRPDSTASAALEAIVLQAMEKEPARRFPTMAALAESLEVEMNRLSLASMGLSAAVPGERGDSAGASALLAPSVAAAGERAAPARDAAVTAPLSFAIAAGVPPDRDPEQPALEPARSTPEARIRRRSMLPLLLGAAVGTFALVVLVLRPMVAGRERPSAQESPGPALPADRASQSLVSASDPSPADRVPPSGVAQPTRRGASRS